MFPRQRPLDWSRAVGQMKGDRIVLPRPIMDWAFDEGFGEIGGWVGRDADGRYIGAVFTLITTVYQDGMPIRGFEVRAMVARAGSVQNDMLPDVYAKNPVGVRLAKAAVEAAFRAQS